MLEKGCRNSKILLILHCEVLWKGWFVGKEREGMCSLMELRMLAVRSPELLGTE